MSDPSHQPKTRELLIRTLSVVLCLFTLAEVNYPQLTPQSQLAIFAMLGLVLCFLHFPVHRRWRDSRLARAGDYLLAAATVAACGYVVVQSEPISAACRWRR